MGKTGQPSWAKRILKLLEQAKAKDPDFERFGAYSHQYRLAAPASEEQILKFEEQQGIRLPEEYRDFLLHVGNGGAGPYYGLDGIRDLGDDLHDSHGARIYRVQEEPVIYPKMSDEEWNRMTAPESRQGDSMGKGCRDFEKTLELTGVLHRIGVKTQEGKTCGGSGMCRYM